MTEDRDETAKKIILLMSKFTTDLAEITNEDNVNILMILTSPSYMLVSAKGCKACAVESAQAFIDLSGDVNHEGEEHEKVH